VTMPGTLRPASGGLAFKAPITSLTGYTQTDPGIQSAVVQGAAVGSTWPGASYINATLINPATVSGLPSNGLRWTRSTKGLRGVARNSNLVDLLAAVFGITSDATPPSLDLVLGYFITNGTVGFGGGIQAVAGPLWQVFGLTQTGGAWTLTASGGTTSAATVGSRHVAITSNVASQKLFRPLALDNTLTAINGGSGVTMGAITLADGLNTFGLYAGWATGVGGTGGVTIKIAGAELLADQSDFF
jgi:hypothetical protein